MGVDVHNYVTPPLEALTETAFGLIKQRFEDERGDGNFENQLAFHNTVHTSEVVARARAIGFAMGLSAREMMLAEIASAFHDVVQGSIKIPYPDGIVIRQRLTSMNETLSAGEAVTAMMTEDHLRFIGHEAGIVASAILATIPEWSERYRTVIQPMLTFDSHPVARAVALADLGSAGMDSAGFLKDAYLLFAEEQIDIAHALRTAQQASDIHEALQDSYRTRLIAWLRTQPDFARGRRAHLVTDLNGLDSSARERVLALFSQFDESIFLAENAVEVAMKMDFVPLMRMLSPGAFPGEIH